MIAEIKNIINYEYSEKTVRNSISCVGIGLHTGQKVTLTINPAPINTGILFRRIDVKGKDNLILASYKNVSDTRLCTCISNSAGVSVSTIEHLMGSLSGFGITNTIIDIDGPEVPLMDGSANDFVTLLECAGALEQNAPLHAIKIKKEISLKDQNGIEISLFPADQGLDINFVIDFPQSKAIGRQEYSILLTEDSFKSSIGYARTFGFAHEIDALRKMGLIKGGSLDNAVVLNQERVLNPEGLRSDNEFVVHKVLDAVGDLYQVGMPIIGCFVGVKSGHAHTNALLKELMSNPENYEIVELDTYYNKSTFKTKIA